MQLHTYCFFFSESPHFIAKPSPSVTVKEKQNVILPCKAAGFPPPVITWYKDGRVMKEERKQFKKRNLEIKNISFEDNGIYTCTAENLLGRVQLSVNVTVKGTYDIEINERNYLSITFKTCHLVLVGQTVTYLLLLMVIMRVSMGLPVSRKTGQICL